MRVVAREPGIHAETFRELATRLHSILITEIARVTHGWDHRHLIQIGTSRRPGHKHIARLQLCGANPG